MKRFLTFLILAILAAIALSPLLLGAPVPLPKPYRPKGPQIECIPYMMVWGTAEPGRTRFYKDGVYEHHYITQQHDWTTGAMYLTHAHYLGKWTWDSKTRILVLHETHRDFQPINQKYTFQLQADKLETVVLPSVPTSGVKLSLQPLKE
jgi:hypothetical protein